MKESLTLYELNQLVSGVIAADMPDEYWVEAELSEAREVRGHCYMELVQKEPFSNTPVARASAKCWKTSWQRLAPRFMRVTGESLRSGMQVRLRVRADFHENYGFSWIVSDIDAAYTMGDMARKRLEIIQTLKKEGVFDLQKELTLPLFAQRIAVVSSESAAGYGDFCNQLAGNDYGFQFQTHLFPAVMQGERVEESVIGALNRINEEAEAFDVVVIIRGGGAVADLSGFDTLLLAENVANFPIPVITGIGHERDESVLDMISHTRVKTPTAAAAFLIDHLATTWEVIEDCREALVACVGRRMQTERLRLGALSGKIPMLFSLVKTRQNARLDRIFLSLSTAMRHQVQAAQHRLVRLSDRLQPLLVQQLSAEQNRLQQLSLRLSGLNPELLLRRGYSITTLSGRIVRDAASLKVGDHIETRVEKGIIKSIVE